MGVLLIELSKCFPQSQLYLEFDVKYETEKKCIKYYKSLIFHAFQSKNLDTERKRDGGLETTTGFPRKP